MDCSAVNLSQFCWDCIYPRFSRERWILKGTLSYDERTLGLRDPVPQPQSSQVPFMGTCASSPGKSPGRTMNENDRATREQGCAAIIAKFLNIPLEVEEIEKRINIDGDQ